KVLPIDRFELRDGRLEWVDVAAAYGLGAALEIRIHWSEFDNERETVVPVSGEHSARLPDMRADGYWMATLGSPARPNQRVQVYVRKRGERTEIVGVERTWKGCARTAS
ncbi:MAG TPA: hypothetical protein VFL57_04125, partial [Bryobacteraceae bacterium]|nr:hypothetical protein [Bryobacteraceae bacterium]